MDPKKDQNEVDTGLTEEDLVKGLNRLDEFVATNDATNRKDELLQKAMKEELSEDERGELFTLMGGGTEDNESRSEEITKSLSENETMQNAFEVSDFLREQHEELTKSLTALADYQERSENRQHEFNLALAKTVSDTGKLVKAMSHRLGVIENQPVRSPKSIRTRQDQVLQKSFADGSTSDGGEEKLTRRKILRGFEGIMEKSMGRAEPGLARCGEDISIAVATFEQTSQISKPMLAEIRDYLSGQ
jgi:hypothetical protein